MSDQASTCKFYVPAGDELRVLSVRQPWASLIASGRKTVELRSWSTSYRGRVMIVSGSAVWSGTEYEIGPRGVSMCIVELVDVRPVRADDSEAACIVPPPGFGFAWVLRNPVPVAQVPVKGKLGLYRADDSLRAIAC